MINRKDIANKIEKETDGALDSIFYVLQFVYEISIFLYNGWMNNLKLAERYQNKTLSGLAL